MAHGHNLLESTPLLEKPKRGFSKFMIGGTALLLVFILSGSVVWSHTFDDRIGPNILIGTVDVGGMTKTEARLAMQSSVDSLLNQGIELQLNDKIKTLPLSHLVGSDLVEDVHYNINQSVDEAFLVRHAQNPFINTLLILENTLIPRHQSAIVEVRESNMAQNIRDLFSENEQMATDATFHFQKNGDVWEATAVAGTSGKEIDFENAKPNIVRVLERMKTELVQIQTKEKSPAVSLEKAQLQISQAISALAKTPITLTYKSEDGETQSWKLKDSDLALFLMPSQTDTFQFDQKGFQTFLDPIRSQINVAPQNARFQMKNSRASEFVSSKDGIEVDEEGLKVALAKRLASDTKDEILIPTIVQKPSLTTKDVNDIGVSEVLGYGISSYAGSPSNRRKNIQNGVNLLNGLIIAPGETFSLLNALKPFELTNGYFPELVIKRDKIEPEVGGGLCQIGTTTFRAVMHAGLPIIERSNHSLVVSYYNDPSNGKPGTDATIYDPAPDFKFTNDTGHYILFQAENLTKQQKLKFTFWGTTDGRKGSYTPPVVSKWFPVPEPVYTETTELKPGEEKCQDAHIGANASFVYTIMHPDQTKTERTFSSHYRALPKICLIGVDPNKISHPTIPVSDPNASLPAGTVPENNPTVSPSIPTP